MNWIDLLLIIVLLFGIWGGWQKGFVVSFFDLVGLVGSVLAAFFLYPYLAAFFEREVPSLGAWTRPVAFISILVFSRLLLGVAFNAILRSLPDSAHENQGNRFAGIVPGFVNGAINATILSALLLAMPMWEEISTKTRDSRIASRLSVPAEWLESKISPVFDEAVRKNMNRITVEPGSNESVSLPFKVPDPKVREDLEARMLEMLNKERAEAGLTLLEADPEMARVSRMHSRDMFARGYFAHETPDGKDPFDRMRDARVRFKTAGENLALAQTLTIAHNGLMNSPGHRANILRPQFGRVGIGILDGGIHGLMVTQKFRN